MQIYMRVCPMCVNENNRIGDNDVAGWIDWFKSEDILDDNETCPWGHDATLIKKSMTCEEFNILNKISNAPTFMESMNDLKEKDIIEYNLKMSQFRTQVGQQQSSVQSNIPKCPTCGSTNIKKISTTAKVAGAVAFGLFSKTAKSQFKCENCGCKW